MAKKADFDRIGNYAIMYNKDRNIDRRESSRTVPMEVLCLGCSRTGTLSMHSALSILGYPDPYHYSSVLDNVRDCDMWMEALTAKYYGQGRPPDKKFFDGLLGHCGGVTDAPCNLFAEELVASYPDAKVVLVERNIESWYESWMGLCENGYRSDLSGWITAIFARLDPYYTLRISKVGMSSMVIQSGFATTLDEARVRSRRAYRNHYDTIEALVPKERLLKFQLDQGWQPLCDFLGKPVPSRPFPKENDRRKINLFFQELGQQKMAAALRNIALLVSAVAVPVVVAIVYRR